MTEKSKILVIGAGASGLFAAVTAASRGAEVTVLEKEKKPGRKLLKTGNGKCNFTNINDPSFVYHGTDRLFAGQVLGRFSPQDAIREFTSLGIFTTNKNGWIYPHSETAESVLTTLLMRASELRVKIKCSETAKTIEKTTAGFAVSTDTWQYEARKVILATGSAASLTDRQLPLHSYDLAEELGHTCAEPIPALVPLKVKDASSFRWGGVRINGSAGLYANGLFISSSSGQIQLTDAGISGIPVFSLSGQALRLLKGGLSVHIILDFFPDLHYDALYSLLLGKRNQHPDRNPEELLIGILPERLIHAVTQRAGISHRVNEGRNAGSGEQRDNNSAGDIETAALARAIKEFDVEITGSQGFRFAQCASGGIHTREINPATCESMKVPGLYLTGEILDIDGECGGWNLQFAWSTGFLAGKHAAEAP